MQEREFYEQILGLSSPWYVSEVKLDTDNQRVDVFVEPPKARSFVAPNVNKNYPATTIHRGESGVTWIRCNSRHSFMLRSLEFDARNMV